MASMKGNDKTYSVDMGKTVVKVFHAENSVDGKVDLHKTLDFEQAQHMLAAAGAKPKECRTIFNSIDADNSNSIEFIEIVAFFLGRSAGTLQDKASLFFNACDIDDSKSIEAAELKEVVHQMMLVKKDTVDTTGFVASNPILCNGIPETYVLHLKSNLMVSDIFSSASRNGQTL